MASASLMHEAGHPKLVLWDNPEGSGGEGCGKGVQNGEDTYTCGQFMLIYGKKKKNHSILIILQLN